jgi:short-subunit dehydrogenase
MVALITGATRGIGRSLCFAFAQEGFDLIVSARTEQDLLELKKSINGNFPTINVDCYPVDFNEIDQVKLFAIQVSEKYNTIDVIVNNVGVFIPGTISNEEDDVFEKHLNVNFRSAWYLTKPLLQIMKNRRSGYIFNICSTASVSLRSDAASYSISKMALYGFSKALSEELRDYNIKVTAILPSSVNTSSWDGIDAPKNEFIQPEDISNAVIGALTNSKGAYTEEIMIKTLNKNF